MKRHIAWTLLIAGGLCMLCSALVGLWAMWASATPAWETHAAAITERYQLAIVAGLGGMAAMLAGGIGIWRGSSAQ